MNGLLNSREEEGRRKEGGEGEGGRHMESAVVQ